MDLLEDGGYPGAQSDRKSQNEDNRNEEGDDGEQELCRAGDRQIDNLARLRRGQGEWRSSCSCGEVCDGCDGRYRQVVPFFTRTSFWTGKVREAETVLAAAGGTRGTRSETK